MGWPVAGTATIALGGMEQDPGSVCKAQVMRLHVRGLFANVPPREMRGLQPTATAHLGHGAGSSLQLLPDAAQNHRHAAPPMLLTRTSTPSA